MSPSCKTVGIALVIALAVAGCASQGAGVPYLTGDSAQPGTGASTGSSGGSVSGKSIAPARSPEESEKDQRGNTPPGMDREGHGPAAGAIVDPTGAATKSKPY